MGSHPLFVAASVLARVRDEPKVTGAANVLAGYLRAAATRESRAPDREFRRQLRRFQLESLALGKVTAVHRWEARQAHAWRPDAARR